MSTVNQGARARSEASDSRAVVADEEPGWAAVDSDWLTNDAAEGRRLEVPSFPLQRLPRPWRDWADDAARFAGAPVDYVVQALLASVAAVSSRIVVVPSPGWQEPVRLWMAAVGAPATGKSPALATVQRLLWTLQESHDLSRRMPPRCLLLREGRFERHAGVFRDDLRGRLLWRDDAVACLAPPAGARSVRQLEPYPVSIVGTVDPAGVARVVRQDPDGAARFLYAWPQPQAFCALPGFDLPGSALLQPFQRLLRALDLPREPHALLLGDNAAAAFDSFRARLHRAARRTDGIEAAWLGKGPGAVARLAGVLTVMAWAASQAEDSPQHVDGPSMEHAVALWWDYYRPHALALFKPRETSEENRARRVLRWLRTSGRDVVSREEIRRTALSEAVDAREADAVIACLVEAGALRLRPRVNTDRAGRPALRWDVNPLLAGSAGAIASSLDDDAPLQPCDRSDQRDARREEVPGANRGNRENRQNH